MKKRWLNRIEQEEADGKLFDKELAIAMFIIVPLFFFIIVFLTNILTNK